MASIAVDTQNGAAVVRVGSLWVTGTTDKKRRAYQVLAIERTPERRAEIWDGAGDRRWVGAEWFKDARRVTAQGNLHIGGEKHG